MENGKIEKEGKNKPQHLCFPSHNILGHSQRVYQKSVAENLIGEKEKWTNKGNDT